MAVKLEANQTDREKEMALDIYGKYVIIFK